MAETLGSNLAGKFFHAPLLISNLQPSPPAIPTNVCQVGSGRRESGTNLRFSVTLRGLSAGFMSHQSARLLLAPALVTLGSAKTSSFPFSAQTRALGFVSGNDTISIAPPMLPR